MNRDTVVFDEADRDHSVAPVQYNITSFGADYDVEGLVRRLDRNDILIPPFQRSYVWSIYEASRFIESLLLGLPVPGIFLARDPESNRLLVIDGQQRLKSLQFFISGFFNPQPDAKSKQVFKLSRVQPQFEGLTYEALSEDDRRMLNDSIIHATIVKQEEPKDDDTSIYHIFERLNTAGRKLTPQQIRIAIYHGPFMNMLKQLNEYPSWRTIYGKSSPVLKDQELILRFLALHFASDQYSRPMQEFINRFAYWGRKQDESFYRRCAETFTRTIDVVLNSVGPRAFRPERALNAAVFDAVMVGIARRIRDNPKIDQDGLREAYFSLMADNTFLSLIAQSTSDERNVESRLDIATKTFAVI